MSILFIAGGWAAFHSLPIEAFPDVSDLQVNVIALQPGRAPEEVEKQVTMPLETVLNGLPHLVRMFSHTQFGLSFIMLTFDERTTDTQARQQTLERLATADLPTGVQPQLAPLSTAIGEIYRYTVKGDGYGTRALRTLEDWVVERNPRAVPRVADVVSGIVIMRKGENPSEVLKGLKGRIELLNSSILPRGVKIASYYDRTWLINTTLHTVFKNLAEGAILVTLVLLLFLGNLRAAAIVACMIPLSLLATFIGLTWRGIPANLLSLGAMDFGIIVDGAVIVVENVFRRLGESQETGTRKGLGSAIERATVEVGRPTFFSVLIIIAAHIPIFTLQRHEGRIFAPMAWTVTSALVGSLLLSLTLVPLLCYFLLRKNIPHEENAVVRFLKRPYLAALGWALDRPKLVILSALAGLAASLFMVPRLGTEFLPELNEGSIWVNANLPPGISVEQTREYCRQIRSVLHKTPEVRSV